MSITPYEPASGVTPADVPTPTDPTGGRLVAWAKGLYAAKQMGDALCQTSFVPAHFRGKPEDAAAAIMSGDEIGFTPMQSLQNLYVIGGKPALYARAMVALVLSHGHKVWTEKESDTEVVVCGQRRDAERVERVSWTIERARKAGYTSNKKYESDPRAMLYARASSDVARRIAPDVLAGVAYTVEELELEDAPKSTRKVKRSQPAQPDTPEPDPTPEPEQPETGEQVTKAQLTKMHACLTDLGITDRDSGLAVIGDYAGRTVETSKDLTKAEASTVIEKLQADVQAQAPEPDMDWPETTQPGGEQ